MKILKIKKKSVDPKELNKRGALESDASMEINEEFMAFDEDTGEYVCGMFLLDCDIKPLLQAVSGLEYREGTRSGGLVTRSRIFGYSPRVGNRNDFCASTSLKRDDEKRHDIIAGYAEYLDQIYAKYGGERYKEHSENAKKVLNQYKIKQTIFTSGIVNKNNPLNYHRDSGNFEGVYSCMITLREGFIGGNLVMPEYDIKINLLNGSVAMFDGQAILHGVSPIVKTREDYYRYTIVYYSLKRMRDCIEPKEELQRVQAVKTNTYRKRAEEIRANLSKNKT